MSINVKICFMWTYAPFKHVYFFLPKRHFMQTSEKLSNGRNRGNAWGNELYTVWPSWKEIVITWILLLFLRFNHIPETRKYYNSDNCNMKQKSFTDSQWFDILFSGIIWHHRTLGWYLFFKCWFLECLYLKACK